MKIGNFSGFPDFVQFLIRRFSDVRLLEGFQAVELCHLQYDPKRGSTIDPHMDDSWLWGERLVTVNIGSTVIFTLIQNSVALRIRLQPRSLLILYGEARYLWEHAIFREDVTDLRIALTFRELSKEFLKDGPQSEIGQQLLDVATKVIDTSLH